MPITGYSMVKSYRRCPKQYEYKYIQHLQRNVPPPPLIRGSILHEILDARATTGGTVGAKTILSKYEEKYGTLFKEQQDMYGEDFLPNIKRVYDGYLREYDDSNLEYLSSEEFISTPLVGDIIYQGHLDKRIIMDGRMWIVDHKTHKNIPTEEQRFNDYQILMYLWAYNKEHPKEKADGIIWDYIRTKPPTIPEVLQKGGLSQAKNIDTDVHTYTKELTRLRIDPKPYKMFLAELAKRSKGKFYQRIKLPAPSKVMVEQVVKDFSETSQIMHGLKVYPRTMTRDCSWCEYYRLCNAELRGLDHDFVRKSEFKMKKSQLTQRKPTNVLGIVGSEAVKFLPDWQEWARRRIREAFVRYEPSLVVSGDCPLGGIDKWAIEEADKAGIATREFPPEHNSWEFFKARNLQIAEASDVLLCIAVRHYHHRYKGRRFKLCYHCKKDDHVKSGGCWTMNRAAALGKQVELVIVGV